MKKRIIGSVIAVLLVLMIPLSLLSAGFFLPPQFGETYYAELPYLHQNLKNTKGKKLVLIGNSSVAFGVNSDLLDAELPDYSVVNYGLYGSVGTKFMLDTAKSSIGEGDIVVVFPEPAQEASSLYFSAKEAWRAIDGDLSMLWEISKADRAAMVGGYVGYVQEKFSYVSKGEGAPASGIYSANSFVDEAGRHDFIVADRPYNVMAGGYDPTNVGSFGADVFGEGFLEYLNEYNAYCKKQGATLFFGFCPINSLSVLGDPFEVSDKHFEYLNSKLDCKLLGHPFKYLMDYRWFYDNNVHLNSAGMYLFTDLIAEDLKLELEITSPSGIVVPPMPEMPAVEEVGGDNKDADCFTYEKVSSASGEFIRLTALTEEGKKKTVLTVPSSYDGLPVREFGAEVFQNNTIVSKIILPRSITALYDNSFVGAARLTELVFMHDSVLGISAGNEFLNGADNCYICVKKGVSVTSCAGGWERYKNRIKYY